MKNIRSAFGAALFLFSSLIQSSSQSELDACGIASLELEEATAAGARSIPAKLAYDCLKAIPLHEDEALNTLHQIRLYLQFYSAQTYFADPPTPELELYPIDTNSTLDIIESNIKDGTYKNEYEFNKDLVYLFGYYRDGHTQFIPNCYSAFAFMHQYSVISVAKTPDSVPDIYAIKRVTGGWELGSKIKKINDIDAVDYLRDFSNNHPELNWIDPDARWNQAVVHSRGGKFMEGVFSLRVTYDDEDLKITWANGVTTTVEWAAYLNVPTGATFDSVDSFYSNVCLRSQDDIETAREKFVSVILHDKENSHKKEKRSGMSLGEPLQKRAQNSTLTTLKPAMTSEDGLLLLYVLDKETGVLVITTFQPESSAMGDFSTFISDSIVYLRSKGIKKIIIDVTGNGGGWIALGNDAAMQFFPKADHFFGTNMRWSPALDTMLTKGGKVNESYWDIGQYHKMDGGDFSSYKEFLGPVYKDKDYFTVIARPDIAERNREGNDLPESYSGPQPFDTDNIILLSSGMCGSTCAIFAEAMAEQGVRSVAFGGRPHDGPMQTVGGVKGSQVLSFDEIGGWVYAFLGEDVSKYDYIPDVMEISLAAAAVNLRNSWRKDEQDLPIEFIYDPAEYHLSYTMDMITYPQIMWAAARDVAWNDAAYVGSSSTNKSPASDAAGDSSESDELDVLGGSAFRDKEGEVLGTGVESDDEDNDDDHEHVGKTWNSIGELIWQKINGRGSGLNITI